jgi:hypothetical protein
MLLRLARTRKEDDAIAQTGELAGRVIRKRRPVGVETGKSCLSGDRGGQLHVPVDDVLRRSTLIRRLMNISAARSRMASASKPNRSGARDNHPMPADFTSPWKSTLMSQPRIARSAPRMSPRN